MFSASRIMASSVAGGCFCLKVGKKEASVWGGLSDQKPSLTTRYSGVSPWGCHVGLLACIVLTGGCQSLLAVLTHTTLGCTLSGCPVCDVFLPMCVHLSIGACARVHLQRESSIHADCPSLLPHKDCLPLCVYRGFFFKDKIGNEKRKEGQYINTGAWYPRPPTGIIFSFSTNSEGWGRAERGRGWSQHQKLTWPPGRGGPSPPSVRRWSAAPAARPGPYPQRG